MARWFALFALLFCLSSTSFAQSGGVIPKPLRIVPSSGIFNITKETKIVASGEPAQRLAEFLNNVLSKQYGLKLNVIAGRRPRQNTIFLNIQSMAGHNRTNEDYGLVVSPTLIEV